MCSARGAIATLAAATTVETRLEHPFTRTIANTNKGKNGIVFGVRELLRPTLDCTN